MVSSPTVSLLWERGCFEGNVATDFEEHFMAIQPETRDFLVYLQQDKGVRDRIKTERNKKLRYAGHFFVPI
jgi:hypothetical protein